MKPPAPLLVGAGDPEERSGAVLGLFSLVTHSLHTDRWGEVHKPVSAGRRRGTTSRIRPSADALALVGKELWAREATFYGSSGEIETVKVPREFVERLTDAVCYVA
jgi:hypothetical protein